MDTEQEFTAFVNFALPEGAHVWHSDILACGDKNYRLQAKSKASAEEAQAVLVAAAKMIQEAVDA